MSRSIPDSQRKRPVVPRTTISPEAYAILRSKKPMGEWLDQAILDAHHEETRRRSARGSLDRSKSSRDRTQE